MSFPKHVHLRIKPHFSIVAHSPNNVELRSGIWNPISYTLSDEDNKNYLLPLVKALDGSSSAKEISDKLNIPRTEVESLIDHLQEIGAIENSSSTALDHYLEQMNPILCSSTINKKTLNPKWPILLLGDKNLVDCTLPLLHNTFGNEHAKWVDFNDYRIRLLEDENEEWLHNGIEFEKMLDVFKDWKDHLIVLLQKYINPSLCIKLNRILYNLKTAWIHAAIDGPFLFIGPTFSQSNPCFECFETRIGMNVKDNANYQKYKNALVNQHVLYKKEFPLTPILVNLLVSHIAMEIVNYSLVSSSFTQSKILSIYLPTMELNYSEFLRYPNCKTCGSHNLRDGKTLYFDINQLLDVGNENI